MFIGSDLIRGSWFYYYLTSSLNLTVDFIDLKGKFAVDCDYWSERYSLSVVPVFPLFKEANIGVSRLALLSLALLLLSVSYLLTLSLLTANL